MFLMTAKVSKRRILAALGGLIVLIAGMLLLFRSPDAAETLARGQKLPAVKTAEQRLAFLKELGYTPGDEKTMQVRIPKEGGEVFRRYNELQKSQGFDLTEFAGKNVMRYEFELQNFPGATAPVHATMLLYRGKLVGGDITDSSPGGKIQGLLPAQSGTSESAPETDIPASSAK